jgi:hypothetical protein
MKEGSVVLFYNRMIRNAKVTTSAIDTTEALKQLAAKAIKDTDSSLIKNLNERVYGKPFSIGARIYNLKFSVPN